MKPLFDNKLLHIKGNVLCFSQNNIVKIFITVNSSEKNNNMRTHLFKSRIKYVKYNIHIIKLQVHFTNIVIRHSVFSINRTIVIVITRPVMASYLQSPVKTRTVFGT